MKPYVIGKLMGRCGNQFYQIATSFAYAKYHGFDHYITSIAQNEDNNAYYFKNFNTRDDARYEYEELRDGNNYAIYTDFFCEKNRMENVMLVGYWQTFRYFDNYRNELLEAFNLPYEMKVGMVSIHVRRGDYLNLGDKLSLMSLEYYKDCISYFYNLGYRNFMVFSDDIAWCKSVFNDHFYENIRFHFSEGKSEIEDLILMSSCEHNIVANSTFSYCASWFNRNPHKKVLTPDLDNMFGGCHIDMIPDNYIKIKP